MKNKLPQEICLLYSNTISSLRLIRNRQWQVAVIYFIVAAFIIWQADQIFLIESKIFLLPVFSIVTAFAIGLIVYYRYKASTKLKTLDEIYKYFDEEIAEYIELERNVNTTIYFKIIPEVIFIASIFIVTTLVLWTAH